MGWITCCACLKLTVFVKTTTFYLFNCENGAKNDTSLQNSEAKISLSVQITFVFYLKRFFGSNLSFSIVWLGHLIFFFDFYLTKTRNGPENGHFWDIAQVKPRFYLDFFIFLHLELLFEFCFIRAMHSFYRFRDNNWIFTNQKWVGCRKWPNFFRNIRLNLL